jgi:Polyketide cyclase / dehydrase and lipid transport
MSTVLAVVAAIVVLAIAVVLVLAASKPKTFRLERSTAIKAPPEKIFPFVNDFRRWMAWSPWEKLDPNLKRSYGGAESGTGATYGWEGKKAGTGRMEIIEATPSSRVLIKLDFLKPFEAHNTAEFTFTPQGDGTRVDWAMYGPNRFIGKVMSTFVNFEKLVGKDFEKGLAALKANAET